MDRDPDDIRHLVRHGGRVTAADGAQLTIAWDRRVRAKDRAAWAEKLLAPQAKKPRPRPRHNPARGRRDLERAGDKGLAAREREPDSRGRCWVVRIYYRSAGGDVLCFDAGPMSRAKADVLYATHREPPTWNPKHTAWNGQPMYLPGEPNGTDALGAELYCVDGGTHVLQYPYYAPNLAEYSGRDAARFVVLPSQILQQKQWRSEDTGWDWFPALRQGNAA